MHAHTHTHTPLNSYIIAVLDRIRRVTAGRSGPGGLQVRIEWHKQIHAVYLPFRLVPLNLSAIQVRTLPYYGWKDPNTDRYRIANMVFQ